MKRVIIESPFALEGKIERNLTYLRACLRDCVLRSESPYASHGLLTQPGVLDDTVPEERALGILAGYSWWRAADLIVFYVDLGWSVGMVDALDRLRGAAPGLDPSWEVRTLGGAWSGWGRAPTPEELTHDG
jgi:hypothetical protein